MRIPVFDIYLFRVLSLATVFIAVTLAAVIFLTQSMRFLELVINSGASGLAFLILTALALPRFFEIILPIALTGAIVFVYNRMTMDSEISVMRAAGIPPGRLAQPAIMLSGIVMVILFVMTAWLGPMTLSNMQQLRQVIKAQYSSLLFREGVFNSVGRGLTVFIRERSDRGELIGLMIHDSRPENDAPVTVMAKRGVLVSDGGAQQIVVYDGSRQGYDLSTGNLARLNFTRYTIDIPDESGVVRERWREPGERTLPELLNPDLANERDVENHHEFMIEIHRRIVSPFMAPAFAMIALVTLLLGPVDRRGMSRRIAAAVLAVVIFEGLYLGAFNLSRQTWVGLIPMYAIVFLPIVMGLYLLSPLSEVVQQRLGRLFKVFGG